MKDTIEIPMGIVTLNKILREHWGVIKRRKGLWKMFIRIEMRRQKLKEATKGQKFKLSIIHVRPARNKIKDDDNIRGGFKEVQDSLVDEGFIWDDTIEYVSTPKHAQIVGKEMKTIITREYQLPNPKGKGVSRKNR